MLVLGSICLWSWRMAQPGKQNIVMQLFTIEPCSNPSRSGFWKLVRLAEWKSGNKLAFWLFIISISFQNICIIAVQRFQICQLLARNWPEVSSWEGAPWEIRSSCGFHNKLHKLQAQTSCSADRIVQIISDPPMSCFLCVRNLPLATCITITPTDALFSTGSLTAWQQNCVTVRPEYLNNASPRPSLYSKQARKARR